MDGMPVEDVLRQIIADNFGDRGELIVPQSPGVNLRVVHDVRPMLIEDALNAVAWWADCHVEPRYPDGVVRFTLRPGRKGPPPD